MSHTHEIPNVAGCTIRKMFGAKGDGHKDAGNVLDYENEGLGSDLWKEVTKNHGNDIESRYAVTLPLINQYFQGDIISKENPTTAGVAFAVGWYLAGFLTIFEYFEILSGALQSHRPDILLGLARLYFPNHTFQHIISSEGVPVVYAVAENGFRSLYDVAKDEGCANQRRLWRPKASTYKSLKTILQNFRDRPHIVDVILEILDASHRGLVGPIGCYARIAVLLKHEPDVGNELEILRRLQFSVSQNQDSIPPLNVREYFYIEVLSKQGYHELLDRVEQKRQEWLLTRDIKSLKV